jgi:hypothetical protein
VHGVRHIYGTGCGRWYGTCFGTWLMCMVWNRFLYMVDVHGMVMVLVSM